MTENKEKEKGRARTVYAPPRVEVHETAPQNLLGISPQGDHLQGRDMSDEGGDHARGLDMSGDTGAGAKAVILGQEFSFSDLWEE